MSSLQITIMIGLIASTLMFIGDMILYYDKNDYNSKDKWTSILNIMKKVSPARLYIGGLLGPLTAFLYAFSFYHIVLMTNSDITALAWVAFIICGLGIIFGGAYHLETAILGLLVKNGHESAFKLIFKFFNLQGIILVATSSIGLLITFILLVSGFTVFPQWVAAVSPIILMLLLPLLQRLPKSRIHMILCGGYSNIPFIIYYLIIFILTFVM